MAADARAILLDALESDDEETVRRVLARVRLDVQIDVLDGGLYFLHAACLYGSAATARLMLAAGADVDCKDAVRTRAREGGREGGRERDREGVCVRETREGGLGDDCTLGRGADTTGDVISASDLDSGLPTTGHASGLRASL